MANQEGRAVERLLTVAEAQNVLGLSKTSTWQEVLSGRLASVRVGPAARRRMIRPSDLQMYVEARLEGAATATPALPAPRRGRRG